MADLHTRYLGPGREGQGHPADPGDRQPQRGHPYDQLGESSSNTEQPQHLDAWPQTSKLCREIRSAHERHHDIREKKMDEVGPILRQPKCFPRIARSQHRIPFGIEHVSDESQHFQLVIHHEYGFWGRCLRTSHFWVLSAE